MFVLTGGNALGVIASVSGHRDRTTLQFPFVLDSQLGASILRSTWSRTDVAALKLGSTVTEVMASGL